MAPIERPPVSPQVQAQMGPPTAPGMHEGMQKMQDGMGKSPAEVATNTVEKILMGVQDETFAPYVKKALATLKIGLAQVQAKQPQSAGIGAPPQPGGAPPQGPIGPPIPGQMPG